MRMTGPYIDNVGFKVLPLVDMVYIWQCIMTELLSDINSGSPSCIRREKRTLNIDALVVIIVEVNLIIECRPDVSVHYIRYRVTCAERIVFRIEILFIRIFKPVAETHKVTFGQSVRNAAAARGKVRYEAPGIQYAYVHINRILRHVYRGNNHASHVPL